MSKILCEPLPIGRIGIENDTEEVVLTVDFSAFAYMLEEYVSFGAIKIVIPSSSPEIEALEKMPTLLRNRIAVIDDTKEIETVRRVLFEIRREFDASMNDSSNFIKVPKNTPRDLIRALDQLHSDVKKLSMGFNHGIQIGYNARTSMDSIRFLRSKVHNTTSRLVLAQLEGLLNQYENIEFPSISLPKAGAPIELINIFDQLINDDTYINYSNKITELTFAEKRESALRSLKELSRTIGSKNYISVGWDYLVKVIRVLSGVPIPESKAISAIVKGQGLPQLVNLSDAKSNALQIWKNSNNTNLPLRRDGQPIKGNNVTWLRPFDSIEVQSEDNRSLSFGKIGELKKALEEFEEKSKGKDIKNS
ncbi:hypothetical protein [Roseivirga thermotolerans]|uniref:Uncharacterized protein n=1 Tax=Roseivirga thermotolerans TaxID=1758176 RepID=A0ABQ3I7S5_9BACT|nr:hypothetical protein [Roseivirga thermotolerans]GHE71977.1 hypothetical protein GCM10011340_30130 [Roseivirga thermotolerans]